MLRLKRILPVLSLVLGACRGTTDVDRQLDVTVSADREIVGPATPAVVTVTVVNRGPRSVQVSDPRSYACVPPYSVIDEAGREIALPGRLCALVLYNRVTLNPGASVTIRDRWSGDRADGAFESIPVPAGRYHLAARVIGDGRFVTSQPVVVTVAPR